MDTIVNQSGEPSVYVAPDTDALMTRAARLFVTRSRQAIEQNGTFRVALSGGNTPQAFHSLLAQLPCRDQIDWSKIQVFFSDERFVPLDSPESNYHVARESLLSRVPIGERMIHPVSTVDISPQQSAEIYEENIRRVFAVGLTDVPRFDLIYLGMGPDGHTASLFPGTAALQESARLVVANEVPRLGATRITFTYVLINAASCVAFVVAGADKAEATGEVLEGAQTLPAAAVRPTNGQLVWLLDPSAATRISRRVTADSMFDEETESKL